MEQIDIVRVEVQKLELKDGDMLAAHIVGPNATLDAGERLKTILDHVLPEGVRCFIYVGDEIRFTAIRP